MDYGGRSSIWNVNEKHEKSLSALDRTALSATEKIGSMGFFFLIAAATVLWIVWNTYGPKGLRFDPFPAFVLWVFVSNVLQILLIPLIMIGQNLQGRHSEVRADSDYDVNVRSEKEVREIITRLEKQEKLTLELLRRLDEK